MLYAKIISLVGLFLNNVTGLIKYKIIGYYFGLSGIAIFAELQNLINIIISIGGNGSQVELPKLLKKYGNTIRPLFVNIGITIAITLLCFFLIFSGLNRQISLFLFLSAILGVLNISITAYLIYYNSEKYGIYLINSNICQLIILFILWFVGLSENAISFFVLLTPLCQFLVLILISITVSKNSVNYYVIADIAVDTVKSNKRGVGIGLASAATLSAIYLMRLMIENVDGIERAGEFAIFFSISNY